MQRRDFLINVGLTGIVFNLPRMGEASVVSGPPAAKRDITNITIRGKVQHGNTGLANVAVTDGLSVVRTDKNGNYELLSNKTAGMVYISLPAGYAIPVENGIARFYQFIDGSRKSYVSNFNLEKLSQDDTRHAFVVWADTQMISREDVELLKTQSVPDLIELQKNYPGTLFHGIGCGDLVWDKFELIPDYKEAVAATGVPFFNVIGNHDMDIDARTDDLSATTFNKQFGPTYYSFNRGKIHYVVLDDVFFIGNAKKYIGYITENQLQWLEQDLAQVPAGSTVVVSLHIPTQTGAARRQKKEEEMSGVVTNRRQLYKILAPYKVHIMSGHTHFNDNWEDGNMMEHNHGTVCGAWWTGPICSDGTPNGYGVYEADGNELKWYYKSTGKPADHQLRIYPPGKHKQYPDEIAVNVWNWDHKWKVEWYQDGKLQGEMARRVATDPWAEELMAGPTLPKKHSFPEASLTDHIFFAKPAAGTREFRVVARDRFGKEYSETIRL
jgi:hypothetical protein